MSTVLPRTVHDWRAPGQSASCKGSVQGQQSSFRNLTTQGAFRTSRERVWLAFRTRAEKLANHLLRLGDLVPGLHDMLFIHACFRSESSEPSNFGSPLPLARDTPGKQRQPSQVVAPPCATHLRVGTYSQWGSGVQIQACLELSDCYNY